MPIKKFVTEHQRQMLNKLFIEETKYTPEVNLDPETNTYAITGKCLPEDAIEFFNPITNWMKAFHNEPFDITIDLMLLYFNTASSKVMLELLKEWIHTDSTVVFNWKFYDEDEDLEEFGELLQSILGENKVVLVPLEE